MGKPLSLKKAVKEVTIKGRGGTDFQPIVDYFTKSKSYDGLIIFTDGGADAPAVTYEAARNMVWICDNRVNYLQHRAWMERCGRCTHLS